MLYKPVLGAIYPDYQDYLERWYYEQDCGRRQHEQPLTFSQFLYWDLRWERWYHKLWEDPDGNWPAITTLEYQLVA